MGETTGARIAVLHTSVHTTHYADQSTDVWDRAAPAWVTCEHFDESSFGALVEGLTAGRFHALALASAALQSSTNRRAVVSPRFADALAVALRHGLGIVLLQSYIGADRVLRLPGLPATIDGELVDRRRDVACDPDVTRLTGLDRDAAARTRDVLRRAESRATGLSPTATPVGAGPGPDATSHRVTTVFSGWRPRMPGTWRALVTYPAPDGDLIALGHSESVGNRMFVSSFPLDRWGAEDLLGEVLCRAVRPRGLLVVETPEHGLAQDGVLGGLHDTHVARGGFAHRTVDGAEAAHLADRFGHLLLVGTPLGLTDPGAVRSHVRRLEHGGSVVGRLDGEGGPVVRLSGIPEHLRVAQDVERHLVRRVSDPRRLLTFEYLALARLADALERAVSDPALIPLALRRASLAARLGAPLRDRVDELPSVDGFVLPTAATAAALHLLGLDDRRRPVGPATAAGAPAGATEEEPLPQRMIRWASGSGAPEVHVDQQFAYLAGSAGVTLEPPAAPQDAEPTADLWASLLRLRREPTLDLDLLADLVDAADAPALLATVVLDVLDRLDGVGGPTADEDLRREALGRLRPAGSRLRRELARSLAMDDGTVESIALAAAATIRLLAAGDPVIGSAPDDVLPVPAAARAGGSRGRRSDEADQLLAEQQRVMTDALNELEARRAREVDGLRGQRARLLPLVRVGLVALVALGVGALAGLVWLGSTVVGMSRDEVAASVVVIGLAVGSAVWRHRHVGTLSPLTLMRRHRAIEDELDDDASGEGGSRPDDDRSTGGEPR